MSLRKESGNCSMEATSRPYREVIDVHVEEDTRRVLLGQLLINRGNLLAGATPKVQDKYISESVRVLGEGQTRRAGTEAQNSVTCAASAQPALTGTGGSVASVVITVVHTKWQRSRQRPRQRERE